MRADRGRVALCGVVPGRRGVRRRYKRVGVRLPTATAPERNDAVCDDRAVNARDQHLLTGRVQGQAHAQLEPAWCIAPRRRHRPWQRRQGTAASEAAPRTVSPHSKRSIVRMQPNIRVLFRLPADTNAGPACRKRRRQHAHTQRRWCGKVRRWTNEALRPAETSTYDNSNDANEPFIRFHMGLLVLNLSG
jgi:hypothetical protein